MNQVISQINEKLGKTTKSNGPHVEPKIWVIAAGKGGVGKTFIASSIAITLARLGSKVTLVDMDLAGANAHSFLGMPPSHLNIRHFFEGQKNIHELPVKSPIPKLSLIQGFWDSWNPVDVSLEQSMVFFKALKSLKTEHVILDISSGSSIANLEVLRRADERIIITDPEPVSIEKSYRMIESYICHSLKSGASPEAYQNLIQILREQRVGNKVEGFTLKKYVNEHEGIEKNTFKDINMFPLKIIMNSSRSHIDQDLGHSIKSVCKKYFEINIEFLGSIDFDNAVWQSARKREPVLIAQPFTPLAGQFMSICKTLINTPLMKAAG